MTSSYRILIFFNLICTQFTLYLCGIKEYTMLNFMQCFTTDVRAQAFQKHLDSLSPAFRRNGGRYCFHRCLSIRAGGTALLPTGVGVTHLAVPARGEASIPSLRGTPIQSWTGGGVTSHPVLHGVPPPGTPWEGTWDQWNYYGMEAWDQWKWKLFGILMGYPPPLPRNKHTCDTSQSVRIGYSSRRVKRP